MHIHAKSVGIANYFIDGRDLFVNIPIPDYFKLNLKRLKFRKKEMIYQNKCLKVKIVNFLY